MFTATLKLCDFINAHRLIGAYIRHTPLVQSKFLSRYCQANIWLKLDFLQPTGSFKVRGALNKLASLSPEEIARGVVTASAGNHGLGLAYAAESLGVANVAVFVPVSAPKAKVEKLAFYPVKLHQTGKTYAEAHHAAELYAQETGAQYVSAYDDVDIVTGQGTCGLEIMLGLPDVNTILVPTGGGGLLSGVASVAKAINPATRVVGVQPQASPAAKLSFEQGVPIDPYDHQPTLADGLAGGFGRVPFYLARALVDRIELASEAELRRAIFTLLSREQLLVEASGAIAIAPLLQNPQDYKGRTVVCILTGANIDVETLAPILAEQRLPLGAR